MLFSSPVHAHTAWDAFYEPLPEGLFAYKLDFDPTLIFFILLSLFYVKGYRAFKGRVPVKPWQVFCFYLGIFSQILALSPPIDPLSDRLFFVHMIQHLLIISVGVPLMTFGAPFFVVIRGLSPWTRRTLLFPILKMKFLRKIHNFFSKPLISLAVFQINYWFWHMPRFYNSALLHDGIHLIEHGSMALTSIYLWRHIIDPYPLKSSLSLVSRTLFLAAMMALDTLLAASLTFSKEVWYAYEGIPMPMWWAESWDHLDDQRLGGLIMWIPGQFLLFVAMTLCFFTWVYREENSSLEKMSLKKAV